MKKKDVVRDTRLFNKIIGERKILIQNNFFVIYVMNKGEEKPRFGIAVGKKLGAAVIRNKLRRQYRRIIDENIFLFPKYNDYIIMVKKASLTASYKEMNNSMKEMLVDGGKK